MLAIQVSDTVAGNVLARWPSRGALWLAQAVPDILAACERHCAVPVRVLPARFALVVAATAPGRSLVLRSTADPHGIHQATAAQLLAELGVAPQVHDVVTSPASTCVVMDKVRPGTNAMECTATEIADVLRPLADALELPPVSAWVRNRLESDILEADVYPGASTPTATERRQALALLDTLEDDEACTLCHGDLSLGNALRGDNRLYLVDPRGMTGDVEYDVAVVAIKARLDVRYLAHRLQVDDARAEAWVAIAIAARV